MRPASYLVGIAATVAAAGLLSAPAHADATGLVDGQVSAIGATCSWTDAVTSDTPPNTLTVDHTTIDATCSGGITVTLSESPTVTFDDEAGTASSPRIIVGGTLAGLTCSYEVTNVSIARQGTTRTYTGGPYTATKVSGSILCPSSATVDTATFTFH